MSDADTIKWYLAELANADGDDIESNDLEICGEDETGADGCFTEQITKIAEKSLTLIEEQQKQIDKLNKVVEAAKELIDTNVSDWEAQDAAYGRYEEALAELKR